MDFKFKIIARSGHRRKGILTTPHGTVETPAFMPVGTKASVKSLSPDDLKACGARMILGGNTYHMMLQPGPEVIEKAGGMHRFMQWDRPMLTDSGGFQVFSLAGNRSLSDEGVWFNSHLDGSKHFLGPRESIRIQKIIGSDIIMAFDECIADAGLSKAEVVKSIRRTHDWLVRCKQEWLKNQSCSKTTGKYQALFGIIQGGLYKDLRRESAEFIVSQDLPGIALGGETIGFNMEKTKEVAGWVRDILPPDKPIYAMGLGQKPRDIIDAVNLGIDIFDCVAPTRLARNGSLYAGREIDGRINIANSGFKSDAKTIDSNCDCYTCRTGFTRSYLHHLFKSKELLYYRLGTIHNIRYMLRTCEELREAI